MEEKMISKQKQPKYKIVTAGSNYLDIDAYACCVAMRELLNLKGEKAIAYSSAPYNYSICEFLLEDGQMVSSLPEEYQREDVRYVIVDVSAPDYIKASAPLDRVIAVYDHHVGYEEYWINCIGDRAHIEFIGAAATLIYREWQKSGLQNKMSRSTTLLLIAAILDNTLNLTSPITTEEDIAAFEALCKKEDIHTDWCSYYFSKVQEMVENDLPKALVHDLKKLPYGHVLPSRVAQLCVWNADNLFRRLTEIRNYLKGTDSWLLNVIDIHQNCSYFVCDDGEYQKKLEVIFDVSFEKGVAKTAIPYLRKEVIKKCIENGGNC
jgi:inorganic pyrophosphatase/manganese-dependent inorganic pyrophosphatase